MADGEQLWIITHNNVFNMQFSGWSERKVSTNRIPPPVVRGQLYGISVDWSQFLRRSRRGGGGGGGGSAEISLLSQTIVLIEHLAPNLKPHMQNSSKFWINLLTRDHDLIKLVNIYWDCPCSK
jgi:hypothetical protein